jgi:hypothetical protein
MTATDAKTAPSIEEVHAHQNRDAIGAIISPASRTSATDERKAALAKLDQSAFKAVPGDR